MKPAGYAATILAALLLLTSPQSAKATCTTDADCDDTNDCTQDQCSANICINDPVPNGTACEDGNACSSQDFCQDGTCMLGPTDKDSDGDTYYDWNCAFGADCDDSNPNVNPGETEGPSLDETCWDGLDNDCDTFTDLSDTNCCRCLGDWTCDDGNTCTTDSCVQCVCVNEPVSDGTGCDDDDECTHTDTCQSGICTGTDPTVCTPLDQCHLAGTCDYTSGMCSNPPKANGTPCDDNDLCTQVDSCQSGVCVGANPIVCTPNDECHPGICNSNTGLCTYPPAPDGTPCISSDPCVIATCIGGTCIEGPDPITCLPLDQCHVAGVCNPATGICSDPPVANGTPCDDGDLCTMNDSCTDGNCIAGPPLDGDSDGFISDQCGGNDCDDSDGGVNPGVSEAPYGSPVCSDNKDNDCDTLTDWPDDTGCCQCAFDSECNDSDVCNGNETCVQCACSPGTPLDCDDQNICTDDSCDPATGCNYTHNNNLCDDGLFCTVNDICSAGICLGASRDCSSEDDACNMGLCNEVIDICEKSPVPDGTPCDDSDPCTMNDACFNGACTSVAMDMDGDTYISDECGGDDCDDDDENIHPNAAEVCDDQVDNDCDDLIDLDDPGCAECSVDADCNDDNVCNGVETCVDGFCTGGTPLDCDDEDICTDDFCVTDAGCSHRFNSVPCDDQDACTMNDSCRSGRCTGDPMDEDGDGFASDACGGTDCDDTDAAVNPDAMEICSDEIDNDCDGNTDYQDINCQGRTDAGDEIGGHVTGGGCGCGADGVGGLGLLLALLGVLAVRRRS